MKEPMTDKELAAIEARANAATPEPIVKMRYEHGGGRAYATPDGNPNTMPMSLVIDVYEEPDREFYFNVRGDVPRLVAEIRRLRMQGLADFDNAACEANLRQEVEGKLLSMTLKCDELRKMLADANAREEVQLKAAQEAQSQICEFKKELDRTTRAWALAADDRDRNWERWDVANKLNGALRRALELIRDGTSDIRTIERANRALCDHVFTNYQCEKCGVGQESIKDAAKSDALEDLFPPAEGGSPT